MEKIKVVFDDEKIICERENFSYGYLEEDYKKLYQLLEILAKYEPDFHMESQRLIAKKFYEILSSEFDKDMFGK